MQVIVQVRLQRLMGPRIHDFTAIDINAIVRGNPSFHFVDKKIVAFATRFKHRSIPVGGWSDPKALAAANPFPQMLHRSKGLLRSHEAALVGVVGAKCHNHGRAWKLAEQSGQAP